MDELEMQNKKAELIARIPHLDPIHSPNYDDVMAQMDTLVWDEMPDPMTMAPGCSCKTASGIYNIFATHAANDLAYEQLKMHEAGHCVLQHFKDNWYKDMQVTRQIKAKWPKFREHIEMEGNEEDEISQSFIQMIRNICQDLEINGKYWPDKDNFEEVRQRISDAALTRFITYANEDQLKSIEKWMDEKPDEIHKFNRGQYPADFGFPNGLPWMGYLHLILTQPNEFMENLNKQVDEMQRQQAEQQQQQDGQGQQQQDGQQGQGQQQGQSGQGQGQSGQGAGQAGQSGQQGQSAGQSGGQQGSGSQGGNQQQGNNSQQQNNNNQNQGLKDDQTSIFDHKPKDGEGQNGNQQGNNSQNGNQNGQNGNGQDQNGNGQKGDKNGQDENGKGGKSKLKNNGKPDQGNGNGQDGNGNGNKMKASVVKANAANGDKGNQIAQAMAQAAENRKNEENGGQPAQAVAASGSGGDDADDWSAPGDGESTNLVDATPTMRLDKSVLRFIEKNCIGKTVQRDRQDPLYNYNRGKTSGGVMRTRITTVEEYRPGNLVALIDVSGSVNIELVKALLSEVLKYKSKFGTKSRIILWDTHLVDDLPLKRSNLEAICCGGGTSIARGIRYAKDKYLKSEQDKLCVISDFEDCLGDWADELAGIKGDTFGVCWGGFDGSDALIRSAENKKAELAAQKMKVINVR